MLRAASLPPSMEFRERLNRVQSKAAAAEAVSLAASLATAVSSSSEQSQQSAAGGRSGSDSGGGAGRSGRGGGSRGRGRRTRRPPDFARCHEKMRQELTNRQSRNITTSPSPYSLRTSSLSPRRKVSVSSPLACTPCAREVYCLLYSLQGSSGCSDSRRCRPRPHSGLDLTPSRSNLAALLRIQTAR